MSFSVTNFARNEAEGTDLKPQIILEIDGADKLYGAVDIKEIIKYGDEDLDYGDDGITYGGLRSIVGQSPYISFQGGTSTAITQQLNPDKGLGDSISSIRVAIVDKNGEVSADLITPDETVSPVFDALGRQCRLWFGFENTEFKEDFIIIFRGTIDSIDTGAGLITLSINSPDSRKRGEIFQPATTELNGSITAGSTVLTVDDTADFLDPTITLPDGTVGKDVDISFGVRINDEIILYEETTGTQFQTLTRGAFGTTAASHSDNDSVVSFYSIRGNSMDLALKLLLSGKAGPYVSSLPVENFVDVTPSLSVANSVFFQGLDLALEHNIRIGDFVTITGASNGANNVSNIPITSVVKTETGSYFTLSSAATLVSELDSDAVVSVRSKYDVWPAGAAMRAEDVDIEEHEKIKRLFLSDDKDYIIYLRDQIELKNFLAEQIYNPLGAYSLPRKSQSSVGFHLAGLLPGGSQIRQIDSSNVTNPDKLKITRSTSKNFFNATVYKFDESVLEEDKFETIISTIDVDSRERIPVGVRALVVESKGLRSSEQAASKASEATSRRLNKYNFGAEFIRGIKLNLKTGFDIEIGDVVLFDFNTLKVTDIKEGGTREGEVRLMQIDNKSFNIKTGEISIDLVDTNFTGDNRFGLVSPSSFIKTGVSTTQVILKASFNTDEFGIDEYRKWLDFVGSKVRVRNSDFSVSDTAVIQSIAGNVVTFETALSFTPSPDYVMEFYEYELAQPLQNAKLLYAFMFDGVSFPDSEPSYKML